MFNVLVAVDHNEERARKQAEAITEPPLASDSIRAVVVHVAREVRSDEGGPIDMQEYSEMPESVLEVRDHLESADIDTRIERRSGDPAEEILKVVQKEEADWVVVGGRKRSPVGKAIFGSVSQAVILKADCSVLVAND